MKNKFAVVMMGLLTANAAFAATPVNLDNQPIAYLNKHFTTTEGNPARLHKVRADIDLNKVVHTRLEQTFAGVPVWNAKATIHVPLSQMQTAAAASLSGIIYEDLGKDLANIPAYALSEEQRSKALQQAKLAYEKKISVVGASYTEESIKTIIYVDKDKKAHYAYLISFLTNNGKTSAHKPVAIVDAVSLAPYRNWDAPVVG